MSAAPTKRPPSAEDIDDDNTGRLMPEESPPHQRPPSLGGGTPAAGDDNNDDQQQPQQQQSLSTLSSEADEGTVLGLFSTRRPKNITAGLSSGLKNVGRGLGTGTLALVSLPVVGAKTAGVSGCAKGLLAGSVALVTLTCCGAVTGAVQIVRGVFNTPEAVMQGIGNETVWDEQRREWVRWNLANDSLRLPATDDDIMSRARMRHLDRLRREERQREEEATDQCDWPREEEETGERGEGRPQQEGPSPSPEASAATDGNDHKPPEQQRATPHARQYSSFRQGIRQEFQRAQREARRGGGAASEGGGGDGPSPDSGVRKPQADYYHVLGNLSKTASSSEIKRAYAKQALLHHPDKNPDDAAATERFKAVNEAYRVLSDPTLRAEYDQTGTVDERVEAQQQGGLPPLEHLIGGEPFLEIYGGLRLARVQMSDTCDFTAEEERELQERRVLRCALKLAETLDHWLKLEESGDTTACANLPPLPQENPTINNHAAKAKGYSVAARTAVRMKLDALVAAPMGAELLAVIGPRFQMAAEKYLGAVHYNPFQTAKVAVQDVQQQIYQAKDVVANAAAVVRKATSQKQVTSDDAVPLLLSIATSDVSSTVEAVAKLVLHDHSVPQQQRVNRAEMLYQLAVSAAARIPSQAREAAAQAEAHAPPSQGTTPGATTPHAA